MEKKEHPHAQVFRWVADGEEIEVCRQSEVAPIHWRQTSYAEVISIIHYRETGWQFRIKPAPMCELAGIKFPVPMREAPKDGTEIWVAAPEGAFRITWYEVRTTGNVCPPTSATPQKKPPRPTAKHFVR